MRIESDIKLDFCDVLIKPKRSESPSRHNVDLIRNFKFQENSSLSCVPIIAANMAAVGTFNMAKALAKHKMLTCLHKFYDVERLIEFWSEEPASQYTFYTLGIKDEDFDKLNTFKKSIKNLNLICMDVANGYTNFFVDKVKKIRDKFPEAIILAGNVATPEMVQQLILNAGADIIKIGIGPGSVCTTRIVTGVGYPQLSSVIECADAAHGLRKCVCADGGCTTSGDVAKAFGGGADFVMLGGMLSGHDECEGEWEYGAELIGNKISDDGNGSAKMVKKKLKFYGMSSKNAMENHYGGQAEYRASEGKCVEISYKGMVENTINELQGGLRSACTYVGTEKLKDFSKCCTFVRVARTHNSVYGG